MYADLDGNRQWNVDAATGTVNPTQGRVEMDVNGDGKIDRRNESPEIDWPKGEVAIFQVGTHYLSVVSVARTPASNPQSGVARAERAERIPPTRASWTFTFSWPTERRARPVAGANRQTISQSARIGTANKPSPNDALVSPS